MVKSRRAHAASTDRNGVALDVEGAVPLARLALGARNAHVYAKTFENPNAETLADHFEAEAARERLLDHRGREPVNFDVYVLWRLSEKGIAHASADEIRPAARLFRGGAYPPACVGVGFR